MDPKMIILYENISLFLGLANISRSLLVLTTVYVILTAMKTNRSIIKNTPAHIISILDSEAFKSCARQIGLHGMKKNYLCFCSPYRHTNIESVNKF